MNRKASHPNFLFVETLLLTETLKAFPQFQDKKTQAISGLHHNSPRNVPPKNRAILHLAHKKTQLVTEKNMGIKINPTPMTDGPTTLTNPWAYLGNQRPTGKRLTKMKNQLTFFFLIMIDTKVTIK